MTEDLGQSSVYSAFASKLLLSRPTLWANIFETTQDYRVGYDGIYNGPRKSTSHICIILQLSNMTSLVTIKASFFFLFFEKFKTFCSC